MDIKKLNIPTLDGPNWGTYSTHLQASAQILGFWELIKGEAVPGSNPVTYDLLQKPTTSASGTSHPDLKDYTVAKVEWNKQNVDVLGLLQATTLPVIWQDYLLDSEAHIIWTKLETKFGKVGGAVTYLQLVNMVNIQFTDFMDLLHQIQEFQDGYSKITSNSHSRHSEDLTMFMFCSHLSESYEATSHQYLDNITNIAN